MSYKKFIQNPRSFWMEGEQDGITISTRIRLARNLQHQPFPMLANEMQANATIDDVFKVVKNKNFAKLKQMEVFKLNNLSELEKNILVEKHLISPLLAKESRFPAVAISEDESVSIMINEEDHIRLQVLFGGLQIREAWALANSIDDILEQELPIAFDESYGYLTNCPTNVGTGARFSVMMHLPALVLTQQINNIIQAVTQIGLVVRGIYGEGSEAIGNLFQISNQITLGLSEKDIIDNLLAVTKQITEHEQQAQARIKKEMEIAISDRVFRSLGILTYARVIDTNEAMQRLSDIRLGIQLGLLPKIPLVILNEIMLLIQPSYLQQHAGTPLTVDQRDRKRAEIIREKINSYIN